MRLYPSRRRVSESSSKPTFMRPCRWLGRRSRPASEDVTTETELRRGSTLSQSAAWLGDRCQFLLHLREAFRRTARECSLRPWRVLLRHPALSRKAAARNGGAALQD